MSALDKSYENKLGLNGYYPVQRFDACFYSLTSKEFKKKEEDVKNIIIE